MAKAVYAGTFDPITLGHVDVARRGAAIFDEVIVAVGVNPAKKSLFDQVERVTMAHEAFAEVRNVRVEKFDGLLVNYLRQVGARVILRGLRTLADFDYEFQMALTNRTMAPEIETLFIMPSLKYACLNAQLIREIAAMGGPLNDFVSPSVAKRLRERFPAA